jgi:ABC-type antimicrobial peptide transport system permease subunit
VEPAAAVYDFTTPEALVHRSLGQERLLAGLTSLFAALTLLLASLGLYGLMAYAMARRTREIGVRVALGAAPARVLRLALGGGLRLAAAGAALGIPAALAAARLARGVLFGVAPTDLRAIAAALLLVAALTLLACALPARRAARVDPAAALRYE